MKEDFVDLEKAFNEKKDHLKKRSKPVFDRKGWQEARKELLDRTIKGREDPCYDLRKYAFGCKRLISERKANREQCGEMFQAYRDCMADWRVFLRGAKIPDDAKVKRKKKVTPLQYK